MDEDTLTKIEFEINALRVRLSNIKRGELVSLAQKLGREYFKRGKEPTYVHQTLLHRIPLSIPNHRIIYKHTASKILDVLEEDLDAWRVLLATKHGRG